MMTKVNKRWFGIAPLFEPSEGTTVIEPLSSGFGWWAGALSVLYDDDEGCWSVYRSGSGSYDITLNEETTEVIEGI